MEGNPENINDFVGDGGTEGGAGYKKALRPVDDATIEVAVFPQMGPHVKDPLGWRKYKRAHWGFTVPRKDDPTKTRRITFICPRQRNRNGMTVVDCAMCNKRDTREEQMEAYEAELKAKGRSDEEIKQLLAPLNDWMRKFNVDGKWRMFVRDAAGDYNRLYLSHKTFGDLESEMKKFSDSKKLNPRSPANMVVWAITRVGKGKDGGKLVEKVSPAKEEVTVVVDGQPQTFDKIKILKLTEDDLRKAYKEYEDLDHDDSLVLTQDQITALANCNEDPEAVEKIVFGAKSAAEAAKAPTPAPVSTVNTAAASSVPTTTTTAETKASPPPQAEVTPPTDAAAEIARLTKMLEDMKAKAAAPAPSTPPPSPPPPAATVVANPTPSATPPADTSATRISAMSTDELFNHLGITPKDVGASA